MKRSGIRSVILASSVGTLIEWYDFFIFGMLSSAISVQFFPKKDPTAALLSTLAIFAAGFIVRPFGALVFGRLGDLIGRKYTFLVTLILMGGSTFLIGLVPGYASIGIWAPIIVLLLRLMQGLAVGGEYGGAATYVAEHAPVGKRGLYTSWIQATSTIGLLVALGVIMLVKLNMPDADFSSEWGGWRYPFWLSIFLVIVSIYIRLKMHESPLFSKLKSEGKTSVNPLRESFSHKGNFKMVLLALFGAVMGQGVVWYTSQFYAQAFLEAKCHVEFEQSRTIMLWAIAFGTPFFIFFGWLSDKIGRKWIMMAGMLLGILLFRPIFSTFLKNTNVKEWIATHPDLSNQVLSTDTISINELDYIIHQKTQYNYEGTLFTKESFDTIGFTGTIYPPLSALGNDNSNNLKKELAQDTAPAYHHVILSSAVYWKFIGLVFIMIIFATMVYGPMAAFLVELFPTKIRYTSMSLPYHIGNGVFGGLVPFISLLLATTFPEVRLAGLWYPISIAALCFVIGSIYLKNKIEKI
jgi:MFS family permease